MRIVEDGPQQFYVKSFVTVPLEKLNVAHNGSSRPRCTVAAPWLIVVIQSSANACCCPKGEE
jgi:hypothetical protein